MHFRSAGSHSILDTSDPSDLDVLGLAGNTEARPPLWLDRPLDVAFGTLTGVQVLRELSRLSTGAIGVRALAERVDTSKSSVARILRQLERTGLIEGVGRDPYTRFRLVRARPLAALIERMFRLESPEVETIAAEIEDIAASKLSPIVAAWLLNDPWWLVERLAHSRTSSPIAIPAVLSGSKYHLLLLTNGTEESEWSDRLGGRFGKLGRELGSGIWTSVLTSEQVQAMVAADPYLPELLEKEALRLVGAFPPELCRPTTGA